MILLALVIGAIAAHLFLQPRNTQGVCSCDILPEKVH
jgi:hypothetical protein